MCNGNGTECTEEKCEKCGTDECRSNQQLYSAFRDGDTSTWILRLLIRNRVQIGRPCQIDQIGGCKCHPVYRAVFNFSGVTPEEMEQYGTAILAKEAVRNWSKQSEGAKHVPTFLKILLTPLIFFFILGPMAFAAWFWNAAGFRDNSYASLMTISLVIWAIPALCVPEMVYQGTDRMIRILRGDRCPSSDPKDYLNQVKIEIEHCPF